MGFARQHERISVEAYLAAENDGEGPRHEYVDGQVFAMGGAKRAHNRLSVALAALLHQALRHSGCEVFGSDMKVRIDRADAQRFYYPDLHVTCAEEADDYYNRKPCLVVEVLSESTERTDRTEKLAAYKLIAELEEIVLLAQDEPHVEVYRRSAQWRPEVVGAGEALRLASIDVALSMEDLYAFLSASA